MNRQLKKSKNKGGWVYLFRTYGKSPSNDVVYKTGFTMRSNPLSRLNEFNGINKLSKLVWCTFTEYPRDLERHVLRSLRKEDLVMSLAIGREYFSIDSTLDIYKEMCIYALSFKPPLRRSLRISSMT